MNKMRPIHPGEILREEFLVPLGLSASALAIELKVPAPRINDIVRERRAITPDTALRLSRYFGTSPEFWMDLQTAYDLKIAARDSGEKIEAEISPRHHLIKVRHTIVIGIGIASVRAELRFTSVR